MRFLVAFLFTAAFLFSFPGKAALTRLCNIEIEAEEKINFSGTEEAWLCGDLMSRAWKTIPIPQQKSFLESFLQSRGFHSARMKLEGETLKVNAGSPLRVERFTVKNAPKEWNWAKKWDVKGKTLNPPTLNEASSWAKRDLQQRGFSCPVVKPLAYLDRKEIFLTVEPGEPFRFGEIETAGKSSLDPKILERFSAYRHGQMFDVRLLELTANRILLEDLYLSTYFEVVCQNQEPVRVIRRSVPAQPRLFSIGAGFDTERGPLVRGRFKWARLGKAANSLEASLFAALKEQSLDARYQFYFLKDLSSRLRLVPFLSVKRFDEEKFNSITTQLGSKIANSWEQEDSQLYAETGPLAERANTTEGAGPKKVDSVKWSTKLTATSHLYEYYQTNPRQGWMANLETSSQFGGALSTETVQRIFFQHQILWNLGRWEPPFLVLGWRGWAGPYLLNDPSAAAVALPVEQRFYFGGDDNIRGFSRKEIPGANEGFLTGIYQGFELRTGGWFPLNLQPLFFFDWAKGGASPTQINRTHYFATGFGLRWNSPLGTIRSTLGHGFISNRSPLDPNPHLQFFFSFGKEF